MKARLRELLLRRARAVLPYQQVRQAELDEDQAIEQQLIDKEIRDKKALEMGFESLEDRRKRKKQDKQLLRYLDLIQKKTSNQRKIPTTELRFMIRLLQRDIDPSDEVKNKIKNTISKIQFEQLRGNQKSILQAIRDAETILDDVFTDERGSQPGKIPKALNKLGLSTANLYSLSTKELKDLSKELTERYGFNFEMSRNGKALKKQQLAEQLEKYIQYRRDLPKRRQEIIDKVRGIVPTNRKPDLEINDELKPYLQNMKTKKIKKADLRQQNRLDDLIEGADEDGRSEKARLRAILKDLGEDPGNVGSVEGHRRRIMELRRKKDMRAERFKMIRDKLDDEKQDMRRAREFREQEQKRLTKELEGRDKKALKKLYKDALGKSPRKRAKSENKQDMSKKEIIRSLLPELIKDKVSRRLDKEFDTEDIQPQEGGPGPDLGKGQRAEDLEAEALRQLAQRQEEEEEGLRQVEEEQRRGRALDGAAEATAASQGVGASESKEGYEEEDEDDGDYDTGALFSQFTGEGSKMYKEMSKLVNWFNKEIKKRLI